MLHRFVRVSAIYLSTEFTCGLQRLMLVEETDSSYYSKVLRMRTHHLFIFIFIQQAR